MLMIVAVSYGMGKKGNLDLEGGEENPSTYLNSILMKEVIN